MTNFHKKILSLFLLLITFFSYQNCGEGFDANSSMSNVDTISPPVQNFELPQESVHRVDQAKLNWTLNKSVLDFNAAVNNVGRNCQLRINELVELTNKYSGIVYDEGLLPNDPLLEQMRNVRRGFDFNLNVAFCAYLAPTPELRQLALETSIEYMNRWNQEYVGDGSPINERFFIKLFIAADLLFPKMSSSDIASIRDLAQRIETKQIAFINAMRLANPNDGRLKNSWHTRHLMILTFANIILNDSANLETLKTQIDQQIATQFTAPSNFRMSTCPGLVAIGQYGSFDLQERGAFISHLTAITELAPLLLYKSDMFSETSKSTLLNALSITRPYVLNQMQHIEFACSRVQYDVDRIRIDPTIASNWNPNNERVLFRYARLIWPETREWTSRFLTDEYPAWFKVIYVGKGDRLL